MKSIRRLSALLLAAAMLSSLAACTNPDAEEQTTLPIESAGESTADAEESTAEETTGEEETTVNFTMQTVQNPVMAAGADPWVIRHGDYYYSCFLHFFITPDWSYGEYGIKVLKASALDKFDEAEEFVVYLSPCQGAGDFNFWAPELHYINGEWYIYFTADDNNNDNHRMYVLKGTSQDPTQPFELMGQITDPTNKWAIDGTVLPLGDELYFIWSGWEGDENTAQKIYIAHMSNPWTIDSERVCLSTPKYSWERVGKPYVNEGPAVLQHNGKTFVTYSASGSWTDDYCLGMLTLTGDDPLNPAHWTKSSKPVFTKVPGLLYGPGHNSFTTADDGSVWMVYHGNVTSGAGWDGRSVWIAPVTFDADGNPQFGQPQTTVQLPVAVK